MSDVIYRKPNLQTFNVLGNFNREGLAIEIDNPLTRSRLLHISAQLAEQRSPPAALSYGKEWPDSQYRPESEVLARKKSLTYKLLRNAELPECNTYCTPT